VLKLYSEYRKNETVWRIRKEELDDFKLRLNTIEQKFSDGAATLEEYVSAQRVFRDVQVDEAVAKSDWDKSKFDLEQVIGVKLEEVL
jgi:outer membrane protein TolC